MVAFHASRASPTGAEYIITSLIIGRIAIPLGVIRPLAFLLYSPVSGSFSGGSNQKPLPCFMLEGTSSYPHSSPLYMFHEYRISSCMIMVPIDTQPAIFLLLSSARPCEVLGRPVRECNEVIRSSPSSCLITPAPCPVTGCPGVRSGIALGSGLPAKYLPTSFAVSPNPHRNLSTEGYLEVSFLSNIRPVCPLLSLPPRSLGSIPEKCGLIVPIPNISSFVLGFLMTSNFGHISTPVSLPILF